MPYNVCHHRYAIISGVGDWRGGDPHAYRRRECIMSDDDIELERLWRSLRHEFCDLAEVVAASRAESQRILEQPTNLLLGPIAHDLMESWQRR